MNEVEIIDALELIVAVDQTPHYEANQPRVWDGGFPHGGEHWPTPREVAIATLRKIRNGKRPE